MKRYVLLCNSKTRKDFNIYDTVVRDTTGAWSSIHKCLSYQEYIKYARYESLADFQDRTNYKTILAEFDSFETFPTEFPELFI